MSKARRAGHSYSGVDNGMLIRVKSGEEFVVPEVGGMYVGSGTRAVSYTHLTLPTIYSV